MTDHPRKGSVRAALQTLESLQQSGVRQLPRARRRAAAPPAVDGPPVDTQPAVDSQPAAAVTPPPAAQAPQRTAPAAKPLAPPAAASGDTLEVIRAEVAACTACAELASTRTQTVFGVGNPRARLCFLGEAPGADEDKQGEPFVGRAGQLLTRIIEACTLSRSDVYILNVLKCRPPGNRNPTPQESANCRGFLNRQLALIRPEFICCLGSVAAQNLLDTDQTIGRLRGKFHEYQGIPVMCTYHPAYLLRNPAAKKDVWDDMKMLLRKMGIKLKQ